MAVITTINPTDPAYDIAEARQAIQQLKEVIPRHSWPPEFYSAEARVEYCEYLELVKSDVSTHHRCNKLAYARHSISEALLFRESKPDTELRDAIQRAEQNERGFNLLE